MKKYFNPHLRWGERIIKVYNTRDGIARTIYYLFRNIEKRLCMEAIKKT